MAAEFLAGVVEPAGIVLRGLGKRAGADKLDDLLRQPDRMHQLDQVPSIVTGLDGQLPAVLLDSLSGAQEADDGIFTLGAQIRRAPVGLTASVHTHRQMLPEQRPAGTYGHADQRQHSRAHRRPAHTDDDAGRLQPNASPGWISAQTEIQLSRMRHVTLRGPVRNKVSIRTRLCTLPSGVALSQCRV